MGIPSYFHFLLKNHRSILTPKQQVRCDDLFVDANSLIYDCIHELKTIQSYEQVYQMVYERVLLLIKTTNPTRKTYICFDGVPPFPKMVQQRQRRFKSVLTKHILNDPSSSLWNTNHITPGTTFMMGLDEYLIDMFKSHSSIVFSGTNEPMEGEHKICHMIRSDPSVYKGKNLMIYGLDADLIMLGLLLQGEEFTIYLYKETKHFQYISHVDENMDYYFNVDVLAKEIMHLLNHTDKTQSICDYIFICFMCGNDFMPHIPCVSIRNDGILTLIDVYKETNLPLIDTKTRTIQWKHFYNFLQKLEENEDTYILENIQWKLDRKKSVRANTPEDRLNWLPCMDTEKEKYLRNHLDEYNEYILETNDVKELCINYLQVLEWTWYYYNGENRNNRIYYHYPYGPRIKDLKLHVPLFNEANIMKTDLTQPDLDVYTQLYYVLPYENHQEIIPPSIYDRTHSTIYHYMPEMKEMNYEFCYFLCKYFWESHLNMTPLSIDALNTIVKKCSYT
jgi:5'-3' exonuclease